jgi:hypothetical protein
MKVHRRHFVVEMDPISSAIESSDLESLQQQTILLSKRIEELEANLRVSFEA